MANASRLVDVAENNPRDPIGIPAACALNSPVRRWRWSECALFRAHSRQNLAADSNAGDGTVPLGRATLVMGSWDWGDIVRRFRGILQQTSVCRDVDEKMPLIARAIGPAPFLNCSRA